MERLRRHLAGVLIPDRLWLKSIYESFGKAVEADGLVDEPRIRNFVEFLEIHQSIKRFAISGMKGRYPDLWAEIDSELVGCFSFVVDGSIDRETRDRLVNTLDRVAWCGLGGDQ